MSILEDLEEIAESATFGHAGIWPKTNHAKHMFGETCRHDHARTPENTIWRKNRAGVRRPRCLECVRIRDGYKGTNKPRKRIGQ